MWHSAPSIPDMGSIVSGTVSGISFQPMNSLSFTPEPLGPIEITESVVTRRLTIYLDGRSPYDSVKAREMPDTGAVMLKIGCQDASIARWRRIGELMIRRHHGESEVERLLPVLTQILDRIDDVFAPRTATK